MELQTYTKQRSSMYQFRIDDEDKAEAFAVLEDMGLKPAQALRLFLQRVRTTKVFPFPIEAQPSPVSKNPDCPLGLSHIPNAKTQRVMREMDAGIGVKEYPSKEALFTHLRNLAKQHA